MNLCLVMVMMTFKICQSHELHDFKLLTEPKKSDIFIIHQWL